MRKFPFLVILVVFNVSLIYSQATLRDNFDNSGVCGTLPGRTRWIDDENDNSTWMLDSNAIRPRPFIGDPCGPDTNIGWGAMIRWDSTLAGNFEYAFTLRHKTPPNAPQPSQQSLAEFWMTDTQKALNYTGVAGYNAHGYFIYWQNLPDSVTGDNIWRWFRIDSGRNEHGFTLLHTTHQMWSVGDEAKIQVRKDAYNTIALFLNGTQIDSIRDSAWTDLRYLALKGGVGHDTRLDDFKIGPYNPTVCPQITLSPPQLTSAVIDSAYNETLSASGGVAPYTYTVTYGALPPGLTLSGSGTISGSPQAGGTFPITATATDVNGCFVNHTYNMNVHCGTITLNNVSIPSDTAGSVYPTTTFTASGGAGVYTFAEVGALPVGMTLIVF